MKFLQFDIKNYKGIKKAELKLNPQGESKIFTLVGLNESGISTILEAINKNKLIKKFFLKSRA